MKQAQQVALVVVVGVISARASANPSLTQGVWQDITPPVVTKGAPETCIGQGITFDPKSRSTIYWGTTPYTDADGGLFKSTDAGSTWAKVAKVTPAYSGASDHLDMPLHIRVDPNDSNHIYAGDGVRGSSTGFFVSNDGAASFVLPQGFLDALTKANINTRDIYDVAADPTDFNHVLLSFHSAWNWQSAQYGTDAGVMESKDGGTTWIVHPPKTGWGAGHAIKFLYEPSLGIGNSNTWLLGTQGDGFWRTTDAGATWTKVSDNNITHGGGTIYYARNKMLYASGRTMRSSDNGATWSPVGSDSTWCVYGDGTTLYTGKSFGANQPYSISLESDGATWKDFNTQKFSDGPYEMAYDAVNGIMYSSNWSSGVWALKVGPGDPDAGVVGSGGNKDGGSTGAGGSAGAGGGAGTGAGGMASATGTGGAANGGTGGAIAVGAGGMVSTTTGAGGTVLGTVSGAGGASNEPGAVGDNSTNNDASADAGCGCRIVNADTPHRWWIAGTALLCVLARRRRSAKPRGRETPDTGPR
jgi:MYXO-CTERM domain-containing protein